MDTAAHDSAGASSSALAETTRTRTEGQAVFGPCLYVDMGEPALIAALNAWGSARDREVEALRADLAATKAVVEMTFDQAQAGVSATLLNIIEAFRSEAAMMQQQAGYEAQQSLAASRRSSPRPARASTRRTRASELASLRWPSACKWSMLGRRPSLRGLRQ